MNKHYAYRHTLLVISRSRKSHVKTDAETRNAQNPDRQSQALSELHKSIWIGVGKHSINLSALNRKSKRHDGHLRKARNAAAATNGPKNRAAPPIDSKRSTAFNHSSVSAPFRICDNAELPKINTGT